MMGIYLLFRLQVHTSEQVRNVGEDQHGHVRDAHLRHFEDDHFLDISETNLEMFDGN
jgi:hypothetical protein